MADRLKEIQKKVMEWWGKFTARQKSIIIGICAVVIFTFAIIVYVFSRPQYTSLVTCESAADAAKVVDVLDSAGVTHRESNDGLRIEVLANQEGVANLALGSAGVISNDYSLQGAQDALGGSISTTASDKEKYWSVFGAKQLEKDIEEMYAVKDATVWFNIPNQDGTLIAQQQESSAYIRLELEGTFTSANAAALAKAAATFLGNETTANITIIDTDSNILFQGGDDYTSAGIANSMQELQNQAESMVANQVKKVLFGTNQYSAIEVTSHLTMDYANYEETVKEYYANADREEGMKAHEDTFESENENAGAGVPGAESNDGTVMVNPDSSSSSSTQNETSVDYLPNESSKYTVTPAGGIDYASSSISIAAIKLREIREEDVRSQGLLDGITWEEYKAANGADIKQDVDPDFYSVVANATGISEDRITIVAYESPLFYDAPGMDISWSTVLSIAMLVIILGLLAFVVLRSMRSKQEGTEEEELSVENLLQSTPEAELEDIDLEAKSETRKMIEKFVDENPEAAASLLRNWLSEDWG